MSKSFIKCYTATVHHAAIMCRSNRNVLIRGKPLKGQWRLGEIIMCDLCYSRHNQYERGDVVSTWLL